MELHLLRALVAVADTSSVTRASELLHCTQPTVSGQLKTLEARLRLQLFTRSGQGMRLTDAGARLLVPARDMIARADALEALAQSLRNGVAGTLRVGLNSPPAWFQHTAIWSALAQRCPQLSVTLEQSTSGEVTQGLRDGRLDVGFFEGAAHRSLRAIVLAKVEVALIVPSVWASDDEPITLEALRDWPWVFTRPTCSYHKLFESLWQPDAQPTQMRYEIDHCSGSVIELVSAGLAASLVERRTAEAAARLGRVTICDFFAPSLPLHGGALSSRAQEPAIAAFLETCAVLQATLNSAKRVDQRAATSACA